MIAATWAKQVKEKDGNKCVLCGIVPYCGGRLESHHVESKFHHPELATDVSNGVCLCHNHHRLIHGLGYDDMYYSQNFMQTDHTKDTTGNTGCILWRGCPDIKRGDEMQIVRQCRVEVQKYMATQAVGLEVVRGVNE